MILKKISIFILIISLNLFANSSIETLNEKKMSHAERANMTQEEWERAVKFDSIDWGWVIMSIGMAIGAGIVFLPVQVGLAGDMGISFVLGYRLSRHVFVSKIIY